MFEILSQPERILRRSRTGRFVNKNLYKIFEVFEILLKNPIRNPGKCKLKASSAIYLKMPFRRRYKNERRTDLLLNDLLDVIGYRPWEQRRWGGHKTWRHPVLPQVAIGKEQCLSLLPRFILNFSLNLSTY